MFLVLVKRSQRGGMGAVGAGTCKTQFHASAQYLYQVPETSNSPESHGWLLKVQSGPQSIGRTIVLTRHHQAFFGWQDVCQDKVRIM